MKKGVVYVMGDSSGLFKIGKSINLKSRLRNLITGNPTIKLIYNTSEIGNPAKVEMSAHKYLSEKNIIGEWFECSEEEAINAVKKSTSNFGVDSEKEEPISDPSIFKVKKLKDLGFSLVSLSKMTGISNFRLSSISNPDSYGGMTKFTKKESKFVNDFIEHLSFYLGNGFVSIEGTIESIVVSVDLGLNMRTVATMMNGINYYKLLAIVKPSSYKRAKVTLSEKDAKEISRVLLKIKENLNSI